MIGFLFWVNYPYKYIFKAYLISFPQKTEHISQKCTPADTYLIEIYLKYYSMDF